MIDRKNKFIIFLLLSLTLLALIVKSAPFRLYAVANVLGRSSENWQIDQARALAIANQEKLVKKTLRRGETRQETETTITIIQPELILKAPPSLETESWIFELVENKIYIPNSGQPSQETTSLAIIQVDAFTGKVF